ncbi:MAG: transcriptional regulator [Mesorhizobium sp.]|nr:MAG: transcriptional regulator [Mesorhizobium sp.]TIV24528.1 MAG: transcriptional regulator [Mesorhizobium sp.]TIV66829.1 MAG: transcriptional regulator [Mesorhizobium sp.]TIW05691.1 MAG: transcriptional regulator [Mesorhizobium sp.]
MSKEAPGYAERAISLLRQRGIARLSEFIAEGITSATIARMEKRGELLQLSRGLYQLPDADFDANHSLAEAAKRVPKGIICLVSALAFHQLTDAIPSRIWMAIGSKDRRPKVESPPLQFVRFGAKALDTGVQEYLIEGVPVRIYSPAKTVVDLFRYRRREGPRFKQSPGLNLAIEGLREALRSGKAQPSEIASYALDAGIWSVMQPYLETLTANG